MSSFVNIIIILSLLLITLTVVCSLLALEQQPSTTKPSNNACGFINKMTGHVQKLDCILDPESAEGPYYLPLNLSRSNITESQPGMPLEVNFIIMDSETCLPIQNAIVDIWHANATGIYSGVEDDEGTITLNTTFLRGIQKSDNTGHVQFHTIYPGWYTNRSVQIHIEVFLSGNLKHTSQIFFPKSTTNELRKIVPYSLNAHTNFRNNEKDSFYKKYKGNETTFELTGSVKSGGYLATMYVGIKTDGELDETTRFNSSTSILINSGSNATATNDSCQ